MLIAERARQQSNRGTLAQLSPKSGQPNEFTEVRCHPRHVIGDNPLTS